MRFSTLVCLLISPLFAQEPAQPVTGAIQGHVINSISGVGIPGAQVTLHCLQLLERAGCQPIASLTAQPDGGFEFTDVIPGNYGFTADAPGFLNGTMPTADVKSSTVSTIAVRLNPEAKIAGTVATEDHKPVVGADVIALKVTGAALKEESKSTTGESGKYSLAGLAAGSYFVRVQLPSEGWVYHPNGFDLESATPIRLEPGQTQTGITISVQRRPRFLVSGKIIFGSGMSPEETLKLSLLNGDGMTVGAAKMERHGDSSNFDFRNVPAGHYNLTLVGSYFPPPPAGSSVSEGRKHLIARDTVEVATHSIDDLVLRVPDPIKVVGRLVWDDTPADADFHAPEITLEPIRPDRFLGPPKSAKVQKDGAFTVLGCDPLGYVIRHGPHPGSYIRSIVVNGQDRTAAYLDLSSTSNAQLIITMHKGGASLSGTVTMPSPAAHVRVTLIPDGMESGSSLEFPSAAVEKDGTFALSAVRPGSYHAVAMPYVGIPWDSPEVSRAIATRGKGVTMGDDAHVDLQLELLPYSDVNTILDAVNIWRHE